MRIGHGFDLHPLAPGRTLQLGGIAIPWEKRLLGHSDGDVALHALCDALLGAAGLGDLGRHFPNSDERWKGASSLLLLARTYERVEETGLRLLDADLTIVAQAPRLAPHLPEMERTIAGTLQIDPRQIHIKATTTDRLGATGRGEGIAATAVVLLEPLRERESPPR